MKKYITMQALAISIIMIFQIILPIFPLQTITFAVSGTGTQGDTWKIGSANVNSVEAYVEGTTLYISGSGAMMNFTSNTTPWPNTIERVEIQEGVTSVGEKAFSGYTKINTVILPTSLKIIEGKAFENCSSLVNLTIKEGTEKIKINAFKGCTKLTSINIPSTVTSIKDLVFEGCTKLSNITVDTNNATYEGYEGVLFKKGMTKIICFPEGKRVNGNTYTIPSTVNIIGSYAFLNCTSLVKIIIPEGVEYLEGYAFQNCTSLYELTVPKTVKEIYLSVFHTNKPGRTIVYYYYPECPAMTSYATGEYWEEARFTPIAVENIEITKEPRTNYTQGDLLDLSELEIKAIYNNGDVKEHITTGFSTSIGDKEELNVPGDQEIEVTYQSKKVKFTIHVEPIDIDIGDILKETSNYEINEQYIENVQINTDITTFKNNFKEEYVVETDSQTIGTGTKTTVKYQGNTVAEIEVIIKGDTTGDGKATIEDIFDVNGERLIPNTLQGINRKAADANGDGEINLFDIFAINKLRLKNSI